MTRVLGTIWREGRALEGPRVHSRFGMMLLVGCVWGGGVEGGIGGGEDRPGSLVMTRLLKWGRRAGAYLWALSATIICSLAAATAWHLARPPA